MTDAEEFDRVRAWAQQMVRKRLRQRAREMVTEGSAGGGWPWPWTQLHQLTHHATRRITLASHQVPGISLPASVSQPPEQATASLARRYQGAVYEAIAAVDPGSPA